MTITGQQLRLDGINANLAAAHSINRRYSEYAKVVIAQLMRDGKPFTADTVRELVPEEAGLPHHDNVIPSLLGNMAGRHLITHIGEVRSQRPTRHASKIKVWIENNRSVRAA